MVKFWLGWLTGRGKTNVKAERRAAVPRVAIIPKAHDFEPLTGALRWNRFVEMMHAEQAQAPGVLLIIDLSARAVEVSSIAGDEQAEILPWLAEAIRQAIRSDDLVAHVEGYRFAALLRGAPQAVGSAVSERIVRSVDNALFITADGATRLGITIGGTAFDKGWEKNVVARAMGNLDLAHSSGSAMVLH